MATASKRTPKAKAKRGTGKHELVKNAAGDFFAKRTGPGQFKELDERGKHVPERRPSHQGDKDREGGGAATKATTRGVRPRSSPTHRHEIA